MNIFNKIANQAKASFAEHVQVIEIQQTGHPDEFLVLLKRPGRSIERAYSTHKYNTYADSFYYGHYDMSLAQAAKSMEER